MNILAILSPFKLDWIQVEVSSCCNASCMYCPTALYSNQGVNQHMTLETYQKLAPAFSKTKMIHLQGWGEPLLNPDFFEMVRLAKAAGLRVGTTTNGTCLDANTIDLLVRSGIDTISLSLAGVDSPNDSIRKGTLLTKVLKSLRDLKRTKAEMRTTRPAVHIAYMLLRSGLDEVVRLPELLDGLDAEQVVISTLDFVILDELAAEQLVPADEAEYRALKARLDTLVSAGEQRGVDIRYRLAAPRSAAQSDAVVLEDGELFLPFVFSNVERQACTENVLRSVFISANGDVSPCVYSNIPAREAVFVAHGVTQIYRRLTFGNVNQQPLEAIWRSRPYVAFRQAHKRGALQGICAHCFKPNLL